MNINHFYLADVRNRNKLGHEFVYRFGLTITVHDQNTIYDTAVEDTAVTKHTTQFFPFLLFLMQVEEESRGTNLGCEPMVILWGLF